METHQADPTSDHDQDGWEHLAGELSELKHHLVETYRRVAGDNGPSEEEIRAALSTLAGAWDAVAAALSEALADRETGEILRRATGALAQAVETTLTDFAASFRERRAGHSGPTGPVTDE